MHLRGGRTEGVIYFPVAVLSSDAETHLNGDGTSVYWQLSSVAEIKRDVVPGFPLTATYGFEAQQSSLALLPVANRTTGNVTLGSTSISFGFQSLTSQVVAYAKGCTGGFHESWPPT